MDERRNTTETTRAVLAWGLVWGAAEASLGHILHWISVPGLAGTVMAPIGVWAMARAVRATGRPAAAFAASALAAAVKMADVFLPGRGPIMAFRPSLAILAEGLLVAAAFAIAAKASWSRAERRPAR